MKKFCALVWFAAAVPCAADWLQLRTPQIELLTDAGEKTGRAVLSRLDDIHRVLAPPPLRRPPLRVFVFASEKDFRSFAIGSIADAFYQTGTDRDFIVLHAGANLSREVVHEYIHWILDRGLPLWFEEGTAELYSNVVVQRGRMVIGEPIPAHLATLSSQNWLQAGELLNAHVYGDRSLGGVFYAESWALAHMLNLAPGWREKMPRFAEALANGQDSGPAFAAVFGKSLDQALVELRGYLNRLQSVSVDAPLSAAIEAPATERISVVEALLLRADLALHLGHLELARSLSESAKQISPDSSKAEAGLGAMALAEDHRGQAKEHFERAIQMGTRDATTFFQLAMLLREGGGSSERVNTLLNSAIAADPALGEPHFILGSQASDDGDFETAVEHLKAAAEAMPKRSYVWHALAFAQMKLGRTVEARSSAGRALRTAATAEEEGMAESLIEALR